MGGDAFEPRSFVDAEPSDPFSLASWVQHKHDLNDLPADDPGVISAKVHAQYMIDFLSIEAEAEATRSTIEKAECAITSRLGLAFTGLFLYVEDALRGLKNVGITTFDDPRNIKERAQARASEIVNMLDVSLPQYLAGEISDDLKPVIAEAVSRARVQIGFDYQADLLDRVIDRAIKSAAELLGIRYDAGGNIEPARSADMTITMSTRNMLRAAIADGLAAGKTTERIAGTDD